MTSVERITLRPDGYISTIYQKDNSIKSINVVYVDAQNNIEKQNKEIQDLFTKGINVLILNPANPTAVSPSLAAAKQANIPVVTVDRPTDGKTRHEN